MSVAYERPAFTKWKGPVLTVPAGDQGHDLVRRIVCWGGDFEVV